MWWLLAGLAQATAPAGQTVCPTDAPGTCDHDTLAEALVAGATDVLLLTGDHTGGAEVTTDGTTISGEPGARLVGTPGGGLPQLRVTAAEVSLTDLVLIPTGDATPAAAIEVVGTGALTLADITIDGGTAAARTGVRVRDEATLDVRATTMTGLDQLAIDHRGAGHLEVLDTVFDGNPGGAVRALGEGHTHLRDAWFCDSQHTAVELDNCGGPQGCEIFDVVFAGNSAGPQAPAALLLDGYPRLDRVTFTDNDGEDGGVIAFEYVNGSVVGTLFRANTGTPAIELLDLGSTFLSWSRLGSDLRAVELVEEQWDRPDNADITTLDAELVPHSTRCPSLATVPACESLVNEPLFDQRIGFGSDDRDQDGASRFCDCDGDDNIVDDGEECPEDTGILPTDTGHPTSSTDTTDTGATSTPPPAAPEGRSCGCGTAARPGAALLLTLPLLRRRSP